MKKMLFVAVLAALASAAIASQINLSEMISATYPLGGKCPPINGEVAYRLTENTPAEVYFRSRGGFVSGYLVAGETLYGVPDGMPCKDGQWYRATRAVRCGNPTRCRFFIPAPPVRTETLTMEVVREVKVPVEVQVVKEVVVEKPVEVIREVIVEKPIEIEVCPPVPGTGECAPLAYVPPPCPFVPVPLVISSSAPANVYNLQHQAKQGALTGIVCSLINAIGLKWNAARVNSTTQLIATGGSATGGSASNSNNNTAYGGAGGQGGAGGDGGDAINWNNLSQGQITNLQNWLEQNLANGISVPIDVQNFINNAIQNSLAAAANAENG